MKSFLKKINQSNMLFDVLLSLGVFLLAVGLANYFGVEIDAIGFVLGWVSCILLLFAIKVMEFFSMQHNQLDFDHQWIRRVFPGLEVSNDPKFRKPAYLAIILLMITIAGWTIIQFVLLKSDKISSSAMVWIFLLAVFAMVMGMPALRLTNSGFVELSHAFLIFGLFPVYAYLSIGGEFHLLILLLCMPISFLYLSLKLVLGLFHYTANQQSGRKNLLQRVGWKQGMFFHNLFILLGFVSFACIPLFGYPAKIFLNPIIVLPIGLILIFMLYRIEHGKKPEWNSLLFLEKIMIVFVMYFLLAALIL
jgi:hypothetical protein